MSTIAQHAAPRPQRRDADLSECPRNVRCGGNTGSDAT
jgi:hypothetical protein